MTDGCAGDPRGESCPLGCVPRVGLSLGALPHGGSTQPMFKLVNGVLTPTAQRVPLTAEIVDASRVVAFYWSDEMDCHVSELECGINVLHAF